MRREDDALGFEVHGSAEADAAAFEAEIAAPLFDEAGDLGGHPFAAASGIGRAGFAANHAVAIERGEREFGAADIDGEDHVGRSFSHEWTRMNTNKKAESGWFLCYLCPFVSIRG